MREYLPLLAGLAALATAFGLYLGAWLAFFKLVAKMRRWRGPIGWLARHWRYRNQITVFRLSWVLPFYSRRYPRLLLNMTENGPTSFTRQWTRNFKTNKKRGTWSLNTPGGGSMRGGRAEKELPGDVAKLPACTWHKTGAYADEVSDQYGDFPIWQGTPYQDWVPMRHRRPGTERGWIYWWDGSEMAHFRTRVDMLKAVGWEPVVGQSKHQAKPAPVYEEWPTEVEMTS